MLKLAHWTVPHPLIIKGSDMSCSTESCLSIILAISKLSDSDKQSGWAGCMGGLAMILQLHFVEKAFPSKHVLAPHR